jgi:isochorismate pyruvate lyase
MAMLMIEPENCQTMADVHQAVDAEIIKPLGRRFALMGAAARIKIFRAAVRDEDRKTEVVANAIAAEPAAAAPEALVAAMWDMPVESSIADELVLFDQKTKA